MNQAAIEQRIIKTDDDAWRALTEALADQISDTVNIVFEGWPVFKITLEGEDFNATMPTRIMPPILELQKEIHRIYCRAKYNDDSTRRLTDEERKQLELVVEVKAGSSEFVTKLAAVLNEIIKSSNMTGKQAVILLVSISALIAADFAWKDWLQSQEKKHQMEVSVQMSTEETARLKIITEAIKQDPEIKKTREAIDEIRADFTKKLQEEDRLKVNSQPIVTGHIAAQIKSVPRKLSEEVRIDGEFLINEVKFPKTFGEEYRFNVTRIIDNKAMTVNVSPTKLTDQQLVILKDGGFSVKKTTMQINAKNSQGHITQANLVAIKWPDEDVE